MIELFIEGQRVDIDSSFAALMTFSIDDVKDFSSRNTSFSKTIVLPGTKRNNYLFGSIFNHTTSSSYNSTQANFGYNFNAAISAKAYIFNDNIQVFKGILRLMQVNQIDNQIDYEVSVFGELGGLVAKIGNKKLEELDFTDYNHIYNATNITNSWNTINGSGVYYPLIDYGTYSTAKQDWKIGTFRPALYAKEYLDKIFANAGYTYASSILNSTRFKNLIIPHNAKALTQSVSKLLTLGISTNTILLKFGTGTSAKVKWNTNSGALFTANSTKTKFTYNGINPVTIILDFSVSGEYNLSTTDITLSLLKNGTLVSGTDFLLSSTGGSDSTWNWTITGTSIPLVGGDYLEFSADANASLTIDEYLHTYGGYANANSVTPSIVPIVLGDTINVNDTIPKNILQKDFFIWIIKLFNLYVFEDSFKEKNLKIEPYVDFFNASTSIDWSLKLDRSKSIKVTPLSELNSRYYEFTYKDDSDYYNDLYKKRYNLSYGAFKYDSEFEFATEVHKCEIGFSPTVLVGYVGQDKVYPTIFKSSNSVEESIDSNIRILQAKKVACGGWNILNGSTTIASPAYYGYAGHLDDPDAPSNDLNFGTPRELFFTLVSGSLTANQFNLYWSSYMAEITDKDSKLLTASFKLDFKDIYNLDFSKFIYVDGSLFRLNKITDFNANEIDICEVQLLKVIEKIY